MKVKIQKTSDNASRIDGGKLSKEERAELADIIRKKKDRRTEKHLLRDELLSFQARLLSYLHNEKEHKSVGGFVAEYIAITRMKKTDLSRQLDIHNTKLSNLLKDRVKLNPFLAYKLEAHSAMIAGTAMIGAIYWIKLQQKEELFQVVNESSLKYDAYQAVKAGIKKPH